MRTLVPAEGGEDDEMNDADRGDDEYDDERLPNLEARPIELGCSNGDAERKFKDADAETERVPLPKSSVPRGKPEAAESALATLAVAAFVSRPSASKRRNAPEARAAERTEGGAMISDSSGSSKGYSYPTFAATSASTRHSRND